MSFLTPVLFSAVELTNLLPFLAVALCIGLTLTLLIKFALGSLWNNASFWAAIILRVQGEEAIHPTTMAAQHNMQVPRLKMTRVHIPFTFRLLETGNNSFDEVSLAVSSQVNYTLQAFWGVSIRELHMSLWRPWAELQHAASTENGAIVDSKNCQLLATDLRNQKPHNESVITLKSPKPPLSLGAPPRLAYPLVVFLIRENEPNETLHPDETVLLVNVVHLRDLVCPLPTSILAQYLKQASGQLSCLKQLYLATGGDPLTSEEGASAGPVPPSGSLSLAEPVACAGTGGPLLCSDGPQAEQLCVVCHYFPLSRALLPCRHTCICAVCFSKLERCPMCRAPITSYFCIRSEEYIPPSALEPRAPKHKGTIHWLDAFNDRLTDFLGFR